MTDTAFEISYQADWPTGAKFCVAPMGLDTPHAAVLGLDVEGGETRQIAESTTGQAACLITRAEETALTLRYRFAGPEAGKPYADSVFQAHPSRFTRSADDLLDEVKDIAPDARGLDRAIAIACATAERFTYGHPEARFTDGHDEIPALGCGIVEGSCVDINTYFLASLRAAGIEAGYVTGYFFPQEKVDTCEDGHCWVVTRVDGVCHEWDIAHYLKLGTRDIRPALNPKPGFRAACFQGMGLNFPDVRVPLYKAMTEPFAVTNDGTARFHRPQIRLHQAAARVKTG